MVSALAWIDNSLEEQRRVREMLRLFAQTDSRDELGLGQIRDVFSDLLFPGISVLHTRARYLLFVPWCQQASRSRSADRLERTLIETMLRSGFTGGLIGSRRGVAVRLLPSTIYRSALVRFGILDEGVDQVEAERGDQGELVDRSAGVWHRELPRRPENFPATVNGGFDLTAAEAGWLRERILRSTRGSLLAFLLDHDERPEPTSGAPWADPTCREATGELGRVLEHAELFSTVAHGLLLLYNLLLGKDYEAAGYTRVADPVATYGSQVNQWADLVAADPRIRRWDRGELWQLTLRYNPRISLSTRTFVNTWIDACHDPQAAVADPGVHRMLVARERAQKKAQSRFTNDELLRRWTGASGVRRMTFRWTQAYQLVIDIRDGLERAGAAA